MYAGQGGKYHHCPFMDVKPLKVLKLKQPYFSKVDTHPFLVAVVPAQVSVELYGLNMIHKVPAQVSIELYGLNMIHKVLYSLPTEDNASHK